MAKKETKTLSELLKEQLSKQNKNGSDALEISKALIEQAKMGNVKAFETIRDTIGEKPVDKKEVEIDAPTFINDLD